MVIRDRAGIPKTRKPRFAYFSTGPNAALQRGDIGELRLIAASTQMIMLRRMFHDVFIARTACHVLAMRILAYLRDHYAARHDPPAPVDDGSERVLLLISWFPADPAAGAHLRQMTTYSKALLLGAERPTTLRLLITHECMTTLCRSNLQATHPKLQDLIRQTFVDRLGAELAALVELVFVTPHDPGTYQQQVATAIETFQPTAVLKWYGFYQAVMPGLALWRRYPVLGIQFNAQNLIDDEADLCLYQGDAPAVRPEDPRWRGHAIPVGIIDRAQSVARDAVRDGHQGPLAVTTLGGGRLDAAIAAYTDEQVTGFVAHFDNAPDLRWDFIGVANPATIMGRDPRIAALVATGRLRLLGPQPDLRAYYCHADLYAHLPGLTGGGMGVAMALAEGLPIVAFTGADPCNWLAPDTVARDFADFMARVARLLRHPAERAPLAEHQTNHLAEHHSARAAGRRLWSLLHEARQLRHAREFAQQRAE